MDEQELMQLRAENLYLANRIAQLEGAVVQNAQQSHANEMAQHEIDSILAENEGYAETYKQLDTAFKFLDAETIKLQRERDMEGITIPVTQALDFFAGSDIEEKFQRKFPNLNIEDVLDSQSSFRQMKRVLNELTTTRTASQPKPPVNVFNETYTPLDFAFDDSDAKAKELERLLRESEE